MILAKKSLSQNFLTDRNISKKIINQVNLKNKIVIEVGPGYGFMTDDIIDKVVSEVEKKASELEN